MELELTNSMPGIEKDWLILGINKIPADAEIIAYKVDYKSSDGFYHYISQDIRKKCNDVRITYFGRFKGNASP